MVAEGGFFTQSERGVLTSAVDKSVEIDWVTLVVPYETALARVAQDPDRLMSKDPDFLRTAHDHFHRAMGRWSPSDTMIDTSVSSAATIADRLATQLSR